MPQLKELEFLIGKKVKIREAIEVCYMKKFADVVGILSFVGENEYLKIPLQATVGRMPIKLNNLQQIEIIEDEKVN